MRFVGEMVTTTRIWLWLGLAAAVCTIGTAGAQAPVAGDAGPSSVPGLTYRLNEVRPGVYVAIGGGVPYYVANSVVIVGDDAVLLVDSGPGPNEARVLRAAIRSVTALPIRYVVDTHFHFDHALGDPAFPEAVTIGQAATRAGLALGNRQPTLAANLERMPARVADLRAQAESQAGQTKRTQLLAQADALEAYRRELADLVPAPSQITFESQLTLWLGGREVRILHLGRGHSAGDTVVFLPDERLICTGDLFNGYIGYMGDAYVDEWADTLARLAELDFVTVIPGHGRPFEGKDAIAPVQDCLRDLWRQAAALKQQGLSAGEAAQRIDLTAHARRFPGLAKPGYNPTAVERIFQVIEERAAAKGAKLGV
jgi:cyclase